MTTLCNILASFIVRHHHADQAVRDQQMFSSVMDRLDTYVYAVNMKNHEILFANKKTIGVFGENMSSDKCYLLFRGNSDPCQDCPLLLLNEQKPPEAIEVYNAKIGIWAQVSASPINWGDVENAALINCVDITQYKRMV